ncbi:hypothetical protein [Pedobacter rhizosphaerae]|uniref:Uncharacterized protein n=1 Tax=Pedobacter rhizosphaerae TaxID=390241 RepID=A0A1H9VFL0_9SPHI|nr:hypothetical protein [Pedobacter rhizosphaerae]SES20339.1 hypothetical protein SAMN04488023_14224 [Pedobacter rhizosphaerae]
MATSNGIISLSGKLGDLIFYQTDKGVLVRQKQAKHKLSDNSKKSSTDFGEASKNATYIRNALKPLITWYKDGAAHNRLNKRLVEVFKTISSVQMGIKRLIGGDISLISGFEFNGATTVTNLLYKLPAINLTAAGLRLSLSRTEIATWCKYPPKATGLVLQSMVFRFQLRGSKYDVWQIQDLSVCLDKLIYPGAALDVPMEHRGEWALFLCLGVYYKEGEHKIADRRYFACGITHAWHVKDGKKLSFTPRVKETVVCNPATSGLTWEVNAE